MNNLAGGLKTITDGVFKILQGGTVVDDVLGYFAQVEATLDGFEKRRLQVEHGNGENIKNERISDVIPTDENCKENANNVINNNREPSRRDTKSRVLEDAQSALNIAKSQAVKLERISEAKSNNDAIGMPPPQEPVRKVRTRKVKVSNIKAEPIQSDEERDSDVYIHPTHISIVNLVGDEDEPKQTHRKSKRTTRTTTRAIAAKEGKDQNGETEIVPQALTAESCAKIQEPSSESTLGKDVKKIKEKGAGGNKPLQNVSKTKQSQVDNNVTAIDTEDEPVRRTRTKTRAMAAKQNQVTQESEKKTTESNTISQSSKEGGQDSETIDNQLRAQVCAEGEEVIKANGKAKKEAGKRSHSISPIFNGNKRQKSIESNKNSKISDETFVKLPQEESEKPNPVDQTIVVNNHADGTVILEKPTIANETVIIPKDKRMIVITPLNKQVHLSDLLTDDEDDRTYNKTKNRKPGKPIFSAFETSPVKKRVEAFEKLGAQANTYDPPKLAKKVQSKQVKEDNKNKNDISLKPTIKNKSKLLATTPLNNSSKLLTTGSQSTTKPTKSNLKDMLPQKSASALKAYQQDFIERELRRREKESEVARKREALLQAKKDENKRKREEKQLKAQQAREALMKPNQEMPEGSEKLQNKKQKQVVPEKLTKMPEKKAQEEKKELVYKTPSKPVGRKPQKLIYLEKSPPLLPLDDCYDSDDERRNRVRQPSWTRKDKMYSRSVYIGYTGENVTNTFFMRMATTPDLAMLFGIINPKKLKRTSSAIWNKSTRFTMLPIPDEEDEEGAY